MSVSIVSNSLGATTTEAASAAPAVVGLLDPARSSAAGQRMTPWSVVATRPDGAHWSGCRLASEQGPGIGRSSLRDVQRAADRHVF